MCRLFRNTFRNYGIFVLMALQGFTRLYRFLVYRNTLKRNKGIQGKLDSLKCILNYAAVIALYPGIIPELIGIIMKLSDNSNISKYYKYFLTI